MRATLLALVLLTPAAGVGQVERYELGRRLKRFEAEWEKVSDPAARQRALAILPKASPQFLTLQLAEAARTVDDAYWALKAAEPPAAGVRWLDSLCVVPEKRAIDLDAPHMRVEVRRLYTVPGDLPAGVTAQLVGPRGRTVPMGFDKLPLSVDVPAGAVLHPGGGLDPGIARPPRPPAAEPFDGTIDLVCRGTEWAELRRKTVGVSLLGPAPAAPTTTAPDVEAGTAAEYRRLLTGLRAGDVPETDLPAAELTAELSRLSGRRFTPAHAGDHRLSVPTGKDAATPCRLFVPSGLATDKPVPLVVALHGAGGSENMFFESYGAGQIVKECQKRGWLLVSPRSGMLGTPPVPALVEKLAERYPIDRKRVFLVGHSMGAGQAVDLVQRHPGTFAAVASLGGGGRVRQKERFETLPVFVGVGTADFALKSSRSLVKALADAGATKVTAKEYPDLEHLVIVREALPDVFEMFDGVK